MKKRIITALVGILILMCFIYLGGAMGIWLATCVIVAVSAYEFYSVLYQVGIRPLKWLGCASALSVVAADFFVSNGHMCVLPKMVQLCILLIIVIPIMNMIFDKNTALRDVAMTFFGIIYIGFLFGFIVLSTTLDKKLFYTYMIFISAWSTDTFAYFIGKYFGKTKLIERISPKKTVAGAVGGLIGCVLSVFAYKVIAFYYNILPTNIASYHLLIIGVLIGIFAQLGDLSASIVKRTLGIKDFGGIMPGHGGMLDRFDSILFVGPLVYFYFSFVFGG